MPQSTTGHTIAAWGLRAQVAQAEFNRQFPVGTWLPYVHEAFQTLHERVANLVASGLALEADYWLLGAERISGVITPEQFQQRVDALGPDLDLRWDGRRPEQ